MAGPVIGRTDEDDDRVTRHPPAVPPRGDAQKDARVEDAVVEDARVEDAVVEDARVEDAREEVSAAGDTPGPREEDRSGRAPDEEAEAATGDPRDDVEPDAPGGPVAPVDPGVSFPPDPAGVRPKVSELSLTAREPLTGALGQTFTGTAGGAGAPPLAAAAACAPEAAPPGESPHAPRFQFILGALLALGLSAIAITVYTLASGRPPRPPPWSSWRPSASGVDAATEIANHVALEYRQPAPGPHPQPASDQLLVVKGGPLALAGIPMTLAVKTGAAAQSIVTLNGNAVLYQMCGLGPSCSIAGKGSTERLMLVRREALELALYTFQYAGADQVVVFLPPVISTTPMPGNPKKLKTVTDPTTAVFFQSGDLATELSHPLAATLTQQTPSATTIDAAPDTALVNALTSPSFYKFTVQASQDSSLFLVLQRSAFS